MGREFRRLDRRFESAGMRYTRAEIEFERGNITESQLQQYKDAYNKAYSELVACHNEMLLLAKK